VRTAIVSDLHLGSATGEDLGRNPGVRRALLEEIAPAERLVLLGDVLELRELPLAQALDAARPFFEELGTAMAGRRVVLVPGNHDHRLAEPLLEALALEGGELGLEHRAPPAGEALARIAAWLGDAELGIAYPGLWLRDDVYATHGHYMDCHLSLPRLECIAAAAVMRGAGHPPDPATPSDYERVLRPIYGLFTGLTEAGLSPGAKRPSERAWHAVNGRRNGSGARQASARMAIGAAVPAGVWLLNRALRARFDSDLSSASISRSGIEGAVEMTRRLRIEAAHVITGHTHRAGPGKGEAPAWRSPGGAQLHNTGSWVYADAFHHPGAPPGPYWPGTVTWVEDEGPPRRVNLLAGRPREELRAAVARAAGPTATRR
jgi:calcineurin-like phosphoesterase family protein